jgi:hypothetical protein
MVRPERVELPTYGFVAKGNASGNVLTLHQLSKNPIGTGISYLCLGVAGCMRLIVHSLQKSLQFLSWQKSALHKIKTKKVWEKPKWEPHEFSGAMERSVAADRDKSICPITTGKTAKTVTRPGRNGMDRH